MSLKLFRERTVQRYGKRILKREREACRRERERTAQDKEDKMHQSDEGSKNALEEAQAKVPLTTLNDPK